MSRRRRILLLSVGIPTLLLAGLAARAWLWRPAELTGAPSRDGYVRVDGSIHMHTTLSDGGGTPEELIAEAQATGLGFIVITDHDNAEAKPLEGYHGDLLVLVGSEVSTRQGHVLGLGIEEPTFCFSGDPHDAMDDILHLGGFPVVAHPVRPDPADLVNWTAWDVPGAWGFEVVNGHSVWLAASLGRRVLSGGLMPVNPHYAFLLLARRPDAVLRKWDELLAQRDVAGTLGPDAHSRVALSRTLVFRYPPYGPQLSGARNHVLLDAPPAGNAARDAQAILDAVKRGQSYMAVDALASGEDFSFMAEASGRRVTMGATLSDRPAPTLRVAGRMPPGALVRLYRDGVIYKDGAPPLVAERVGAGVYRVEVVAGGWSMPWVISNPIYVFDAVTAARRAAVSAWPARPQPLAPDLILDDFEGATSFAPEYDESSAMEQPILEAEGGLSGSRAARIAFRLGRPTQERPYTWCALVSRESRDLSGSKGVTFAVRADGVYRLWVQVRDENPASSDEQTEWWFASVRTSAEWQRVRVPYDTLFSLNPHTDGRLDPDRVRGLVFVLDQKAVPPGTQGTIWIDDVGVYE